jgi:hypothetical protein
MTMTFTPAQIWTLREAANHGLTVGRVNHTKATIGALVRRGLLVQQGRTTIEAFGRPLCTKPVYVLTDAGREAVACLPA